MRGLLVCTILVIVCSLVGHGSGIAIYAGGGRAETWIANLVIFAVALGIAGRLVKQRWDGVFIDRECRISLSRFQLILWTLLLVSALMTVGLTNTMADGLVPAPPTGMKAPVGPLDIYIPSEIWALLGLGSLTAVSAPGIKASRRIARNNSPGTPFH